MIKNGSVACTSQKAMEELGLINCIVIDATEFDNFSKEEEIEQPFYGEMLKPSQIKFIRSIAYLMQLKEIQVIIHSEKKIKDIKKFQKLI